MVQAFAAASHAVPWVRGRKDSGFITDSKGNGSAHSTVGSKGHGWMLAGNVRFDRVFAAPVPPIEQWPRSSSTSSGARSFATVQEHEAWCGRGLRAETDWSADPTLLNQLKVQNRDPSLADWAGALDLYPFFFVLCNVRCQHRYAVCQCLLSMWNLLTLVVAFFSFVAFFAVYREPIALRCFHRVLGTGNARKFNVFVTCTG